MKLSIGIITYNEERILGKTLDAVRGLADEIIIVDSSSSDATIEIAKSKGAKVYTEEWKGFGPQKNSVIEKCKGEWILLIDADEVISKELKEAIKNIINGKNKYEVYDINRCSVCFGKELKYGGWSNQYATRLWKKSSVRVSDNLVHEEFETKSTKGKIKEKIYHHTYLTLSDYITRFDRYTTLGAEEYVKRGKKSSFFNIVINPFFKFIRMYIFRLGFLDGIEGLIIALFSGMYTMTKYFKLREMEKTSLK
ncbi:MAG: glycosyltransferase family 2 protein [Psychrilyobacter sp.]|uniref:glycosyltransferase family 2 protein n=1 Tax=Psychrilyobacter sp. TaxID=2586924 RepID=UPI003C72E711